jgi:hypothetical protein
MIVGAGRRERPILDEFVCQGLMPPKSRARSVERTEAVTVVGDIL